MKKIKSILLQLSILAISSCGKGLPNPNGSEDVGEHGLPKFNAQTPCTTACVGTTAAVAQNDPTGSGTSVNPLSAVLL